MHPEAIQVIGLSYLAIGVVAACLLNARNALEMWIIVVSWPLMALIAAGVVISGRGGR